MPHIVIEYSKDVAETSDFPGLFRRLHTLVAEQLPADIGSFKSRAILLEDTFTGARNESPFVHTTLKVLPIPGRTNEKLREVGEQVLEVLKKHFAVSCKQTKLKISLEVTWLSEVYFKYDHTCV